MDVKNDVDERPGCSCVPPSVGEGIGRFFLVKATICMWSQKYIVGVTAVGRDLVYSWQRV